MARPYAGAAGTHLFFGILSMAAGVAWICLIQFYEPLRIADSNGNQPLWDVIPEWLTVIMSAKLICGFWFFVTGAVGCCIKERGCSEGVFVALNVLNTIIWAPALLLVMAALTYGFTIGTPFLSNLVNSNGIEDQANLFASYLWLWVFPGIGLLVGVGEFILSIVSYSIACCCRPQSDDGYEYQYEMK